MATSTVPLTSQVGGHAGVLTSEDGSLLIKPALPLELHFYQTLLSEPNFAPLVPFLPKFYGTLKLEGQVVTGAGATTTSTQPGEVAGIHVTAVDESVKQEEKDEIPSFPSFRYIQSLVLENLSHPFLKPNILDIKLGTVLYDESADEMKVARMKKTARDTTSFETGVRLTGFQVYDHTLSQAVNTPKSYGKSIKASDLPEGIARFFPLSPADATTPTVGLPGRLLLPILRAIREDVADIRETFKGIEMRMVGGSLLIIYEADWERVDEGVKFLEEGGEEEEGEEEEEEEEEEEDKGGVKKPGAPYVVKMIDFAHTRMKPGEGPDEGVLLGFDTVLGLLDGRIKEVLEAEG